MLWPWRVSVGLDADRRSGLETGVFGCYLIARALRIDRLDQAADVESEGHVDEDL